MRLQTANTLAVVNEPFVVDVILSSPKGLGFDQIGFALQYNPVDIMPVEGQDAEGRWIPASVLTIREEAGTAETKAGEKEKESPYLFDKKASNYTIQTNQIDSANGFFYLSAKVKNETSVDSGLIARINFVPLKETKKSSIQFVFEDVTADKESKPPLLTYLVAEKVDQLGSKFNPKDGVINLDLQIFNTREEVPDRAEIIKANEKYKDEGDDSTFNTRLYLIPRSKQVDMGDFLDVDVYLDNPDRELIDSVSLLIAYNTNVLEAVDLDERMAGININDENYLRDFPLDFSILNSVDIQKGIIDYRKRGYRVPARGDGVFATIRFKALRPTTKTTFRVLYNETGGRSHDRRVLPVSRPSGRRG